MSFSNQQITFPEIILIGVIFYAVFLFLLFWIRHCVQFGVLCPFSSNMIHCCHIVPCQNPNVCTRCLMDRTPSHAYCCNLKHKFYDSCECLKCTMKCFKPECVLVCCCCEFYTENETVDEKF